MSADPSIKDGRLLKVKPRNKIEQDEHHDIANARKVLNVTADGCPVDETNPLHVTGDITVEDGGKEIPKIYNIPIAVANFEIAQILPANTKSFSLFLRGGSGDIKLAVEAGKSGTEYITIRQGVREKFDNLRLSASTIYFQSTKAGRTIEIFVWT